MSKLLPKTGSFLQERLKFIKIFTSLPAIMQTPEYDMPKWEEGERRVNELISILDKLDAEFNSVSLEFKNDSKAKFNAYIEVYISFQRSERDRLASIENSFDKLKYKEFIEGYHRTIREANDCLVEILFVLQ